MDDLVTRLKQNRDEFLATASQITDAQADISLGEGDWTVWGVLAHLAAAEWQLRRMAEISATQPDVQFEPFDVDELNARSVQRYEGQSVSQLVEQWRANREKTIEFAAALKPEQTQHSVQHPRYGEINAVDPIERTMRHTAEHLTRLRAVISDQ